LRGRTPGEVDLRHALRVANRVRVLRASRHLAEAIFLGAAGATFARRSHYARRRENLLAPLCHWATPWNVEPRDLEDDRNRQRDAENSFGV